MLPNIANGTARRCQARARSTGEQCKKLAVGSCRTCMSHGGHKKVKRGASHPHYKHGNETQFAKAERSRRLAELRELEALLFRFDLAVGARWRGRKPKPK